MRHIFAFMEWLRKNTGMFAILSLTLGLAPFNPPHIWGKLQWIAGGGAFSGDHPMGMMDWMDVLMHGTPWVFLIAAIVAHIQTFFKKSAG